MKERSLLYKYRSITHYKKILRLLLLVEPVAFSERQNGICEITIHKVVKDVAGKLMFGGIVKHIYTLEDGLLRTMDIIA